ncbi:MAG: carbohydrate ABC transporter permease [Nocardioidaceae bacterium]
MSAATEPATAPPGRPQNKPRRRSLLNTSEGGGAPLLVAPTLVLLGVVILYPVLRGIWMSFQKDPGLNKATGLFEQGGFAGLSNYTHWILQRCDTAGGGTAPCPTGSLGAEFWNAVYVTVLFTVFSVVIEVVLGMWFAMIMHRSFKGRGLLRASVLIPWAIPTAVTAKLWYFIFAYAGIANSLFGTHILWTGDAWPARFAVIIADVWKTTPFIALLILAGLQVIPDDVYEAAKVDGATTWQRFTQITLPLVKPALMVAILFRTLDVLRIFDLPYILTGGGGGKGDATTTLSILVISQIREGFNSAAALSTLTFLFIFAVAFFFVRFLGANVVQTQDEQRKAAH